MVGVPKLTGDKEILSGDFSSDQRLKGLSNLCLVSIHMSTVNMSIAALDRMANSTGDFTRGRLPGTESNLHWVHTDSHSGQDTFHTNCLV